MRKVFCWRAVLFGRGDWRRGKEEKNKKNCKDGKDKKKGENPKGKRRNGPAIGGRCCQGNLRKGNSSHISGSGTGGIRHGLPPNTADGMPDECEKNPSV